MSVLLLISAIIVLLSTLGVVIASHRTMQRLHPSPRREEYIAQITRLLTRHEPLNIKARSRRSRMALAEAIYIVVSHTYGSDNAPLRSHVEQTHLDRFIMRRLRFAHGAQRARLLMMMSALPSCRYSVEHFSRYAHSRDSDVRISTLCLTLAINPTLAIRSIAQLEYTLTPYDISRIVALLRRGILPIAYEPLLASENRNLRMLGLAIVRSFGIEIAERQLHNIIVKESDHALVSETIYTLASLSRPLHHARIRDRVEQMNATERKSLCRHLSAEGYSLPAVRGLFSEEESSYAETLINSYKRALARTTTIA